MLDFDSQDIRDAVAVRIASKTKRDIMASIAVIAEFGPIRGTDYHLLTGNKKQFTGSLVHDPSLLDGDPWGGCTGIDIGRRGWPRRWGAISGSAYDPTLLVSDKHLRYMRGLDSAHLWAR
jgi:hypothetical protein